MKIQAILIPTLLAFSFCHGQKINQTYYGVSSDSLHGGHQLVFKTDTTLEVSTFPRHMSEQFKIALKYKRTGKTIRLTNNSIIEKDSLSLSNYGLTQFIDGTIFTIDKKAIVDTFARMVYVLYKDFSKRYYLTYIIGDTTFKQETGLSDAYGIVKRNSKENKALKEKLASINSNLDNYTVAVYKGLDAYERFGYDSVFGVIVIRHNN